jgi:hypothetical protein
MVKLTFTCDLCVRDLEQDEVYGVQAASPKSPRVIVLVRVLDENKHGTKRHVCKDCVSDIKEQGE